MEMLIMLLLLKNSLYKIKYLGNVDYAATAEELEQHFHGCGSINRLGIRNSSFFQYQV